MSSKAKFFNRIKPGCMACWGSMGILPSVAAAQTAVESGWGDSALAYTYNNYWGVKSFDASQKRVQMWTTEHYNGRVVKEKAYFRVYESLEDGFINGYGRTLKLDRYAKARGLTDPRNQITAIKNAGYATDTVYVSTIMLVVDGYADLRKWDQEAIKSGAWKGKIDNTIAPDSGGGSGGSSEESQEDIIGEILASDPQGFYTFDSDYIEKNKYTRPGIKLNGVAGIVLRDAGTKGLKLGSIKKAMASGNSGKKKSFHILIDSKDTKCIIPLDEVAYHSDPTNNLLPHLKANSSKYANGNMNLSTISIGICRESNGTIADGTSARLVAVLAELVNHYSLPVEAIYTGTGVDGSMDPQPYYENPFDYSTILGIVKYQRNQNTPLLNENFEKLKDLYIGDGSNGGGTSSSEGTVFDAGTGKRAAVIKKAEELMGWNMIYSQTDRHNIKVNGASDCSSFTQYVYQQAIGLDPGSRTADQIKNGVEIPRDQALPGDLIHWKGHVGIAADKGAKNCIHSAVNKGKRGNIIRVSTDLITLTSNGFIGVRRYFNDDSDSSILGNLNNSTLAGEVGQLDPSKKYVLKVLSSITVYSGDSNISTSVRKLNKNSEVQILSSGSSAFRIGDGEWIRRSDSSKYEIKVSEKGNGSIGDATTVISSPVRTSPTTTAPYVTEKGSTKQINSNIKIPVYAAYNNMLLITPPGQGQDEWIPAAGSSYSSKTGDYTTMSIFDLDNETTGIGLAPKTVQFVGRHANGKYDAILGTTPVAGTVIGNAGNYKLGATVRVSVPQVTSANGNYRVGSVHSLNDNVVYIYFRTADEASNFGTRIGTTTLVQ